MVEHAAEEMQGELREAELRIRIVEQVGSPVRIPHRHMRVAPVARQAEEGLRHEGGAEPVLLGNRLHHEFEEGVPVGRHENIVIVPVHLELAVGVLMVVLVGAPAEREHGVADLGHDIVAAHQGLLVVAGFGVDIARVRNAGAIGVDQVVLGLDAGLHPEPLGGGPGDEVLQDDTRCLLDRPAVHDEVARDPRHVGLPGKPDDACRVGDRQHVGMGGRHVQIGSEPGEPRARFLHRRGGGRGHQFGALHAAYVCEIEQEIPDIVCLREGFQLAGHGHPFGL